MKVTENKTRAIYHKQHCRLVDDDTAMKRFLGMFTEEYFGLGGGWFHGKRLLDAGCGDTMKTVIRFHQFGCRDITAMDLGKEFIPVGENVLKKYGVDGHDVHFVSGNVLEIPFDDESFDFVCCHGVIMHLSNLDEMTKAFGELARVTKKGGYLYVVFMNDGGLLEDAVFPALREYYRNNEEFSSFIDDLSTEDFQDVLSVIQKGMLEHTGERVDLKQLQELLDLDLCVTIQNVLQAPTRIKIPPKHIKELFSSSGFPEPRRLRRFVKRQNIRKFFAPLHFDTENRFSRILYGTGAQDYLARKE